MKINLLRSLVLILSFGIFIPSVYPQTTKTVGGSGADYPTLQAAFAAINNGTIQGQIILQIAGNTTETALTVLYASGTGLSNYTSVLIYPTGTFTISNAANRASVELNGADNVTIDGRISQIGSTQSLTITAPSTEAASTAIRFVNSAENNTVKYCNLSSSSTSSAMGIVTIAGSNTGNGNNNNILEYCNLTNAGSRPYNGIVSSGTGGRDNTGCIIRNNNIYNTFQTSVSSNVININSASTGFTISGNSIYETGPFVATANALAYNAIRISTSTAHTVSGNFIGGREPLCGGGAWTITAQRAAYFCGIYAYAGAGTATVISDNTIANIDFSSKEDNPWDGIFLYTGNFEVTGNTIGSPTGTASIVSRTPVPLATTTISGGVVTGITLHYGGSNYSTTPPIITFTAPPVGGTAPTATAIVTDGVVTGFTDLTGGSGYTTAPAVIFDGQQNNYSTSHGMIQNSTGTVNITGNNIGSITIISSDYYSHGFESIYIRTVAATTSLTNNLIGSLETANSINVSSAAASSLIKQDVYGIYGSSSLLTTISGNTVANLTNAYAGTLGTTRIRGIQTTAGSNIIQNNTVRNISASTPHTNTTSAASVIGISQTSTTTGTTQTVTGNTVYDLSNTSTASANVHVYGMYFTGPSTGTNTVSGNFVHSLSVSSASTGAAINGIFINSGVVTCANNIINLGGNSLGYLINGLWDGTSAGNNVNFYFNTVYIGGSVSSGATSNTSCFWNANNTSVRNYRNNILYNARTGGTTGKHYAIVLAGVTNLTIDFNDYYISGTGGVLGKIGTQDKTTLDLWKTATGQDANSLSINPDFITPGGRSAINYFPSATLSGTKITGLATDYYGITRADPPIKRGALEKNGNVWQGGTSSDFNTASNWTSGTVPASGADIIFATSPNHDCILDANRTLGMISNGSSKNLVVNGHTLTVNNSLNFTGIGKINASTASSVVKFAGTSAQTIPADAFAGNTMAGLETANSEGTGLSGDITVSTSLTLTSGILTVGSNIFTYSGSSPTSTGGTIDASNAAAELVFANASAIALPATYFTGAVNNLSITASGGLTAGSDITVNGVLNLASANPTATKGLLEMVTNYGTYPGRTGTNPNYYTDYNSLSSFTLYMGSSATTTGTGDVTGIVKRNYTITANTPYTFGNQFTTVSLTPGTAMPTSLKVIITIGETAVGPNNSDIIRDAAKRTYEIIPENNASGNYVTANFHYLESELVSSVTSYTNSEQKLTTMDYDIGPQGFTVSDEHGRANYDYTNNYIGLSSVPIGYFIYNESTHDWRTIFALRDYGEGYFTWDGSTNTDWNTADNWTVSEGGSGVPTNTGHVIIPNVTTTNNRSPILPTGNTTINTISIENGGILDMGTDNRTLTIANSFSGGWEDQNPIGNNPGNSTVVFDVPANPTYPPHTTISGNTRFYNVQLADEVDVTNQAGSTMKIENSITKIETGTGKWYADVFDNTVEYNKSGDQTILMTDGTKTYWNLTLSGSGTKTLPSSPISLQGNLNLSGTANSTTADALSIGGNLFIGTGSTLGTGTYSHEIKGNIYCDGTLTPGTGSTITLNGNSAQSIQGEAATIALGGLTVSNTDGVTLYNHATTDALNISSGAFAVIAGKSVTASGNTTLGSAQCLVLKSDETGTASFIDNGNIGGSGTARIERYITPYDVVSDLKFHYLSSPVAAQSIESEFIDLPIDLITDFYKWDEPTNYWISYRNGDWDLGENPEYHEKNPDFTENNFVPGTGYMVAYPSAVTKNFVGVPNTSNSGIDMACTKTTGGWNLLGNPFPSSVDWTSVNVERTNVDAALYFYDNLTLSYKYYVDLTGGTGTATQFIAPMQGFMVHASAAMGNVRIKNTARTHSSQNVFYKEEPLTTNILDLKVEGNDKNDYTRVCFYEQATENHDADFDAYKLFSYSGATSELYSKTLDQTSLAINTLPLAMMEDCSVPVSFKAGMAGNYTLSAERLSSFDATTSIILEDKVTGASQKLNNNPVYSFSATAQDAVDRFVLHFKDATSVFNPVKPEAIVAWYHSGTLYVYTEEGSTDVDIYNLQDQKLSNFKLHGGGLKSVPIKLQTGVYFVRLIHDGKMKTRKIIMN